MSITDAERNRPYPCPTEGCPGEIRWFAPDSWICGAELAVIDPVLVGYVVTIALDREQRARDAWQTAENAKASAAWRAKEAQRQARPPVPTWLYRMFDSAGQLLYVGITSQHLEARWSHHRSKWWWPLVARRLVELHPSRDSAAEAERRIIRSGASIANLDQLDGQAWHDQHAREAAYRKRVGA